MGFLQKYQEKYQILYQHKFEKYFFSYVIIFKIKYKGKKLSCIEKVFMYYVAWFLFSLIVFGITDFFKSVNKRNESMNLVNSYIYEIVFVSVYIPMVIVDTIDDMFFDK